MKLSIPTITQPLRLAEYAPEFGEQTIRVWVNQPISRLEQFASIAQRQPAAKRALREACRKKKPDKAAAEKAIKELEEIGAELMAWLAETWSQGPEDTRLDLEAVEEIARECLERDSGLYEWLVRQTWEIVTNYRLQIKKN
jgi:hypothetical protein